MKKSNPKARKERSTGGAQALNLGPRGVSENDSPVINALKQKPRDRSRKTD